MTTRLIGYSLKVGSEYVEWISSSGFKATQRRSEARIFRKRSMALQAIRWLDRGIFRIVKRTRRRMAKLADKAVEAREAK